MEVYTLLEEYVGLTTVLVFVAVFLLSYAGTRKPVGIPPGPPILVPGLGNIPNMIGMDPLAYFQNLRETYGDIFSVYIGSQLTIVLNGYPAIKDAMVREATFFSDRPKQDFIASVWTQGDGGIIYSSGKSWRQQRHFAANALKSIGLRKEAFEEHVNAEITSLLDLIDSHEGQPFDMKECIVFTVANIISVLLTNKRFEAGDSALKTYIEKQDLFFQRAGLASILANAFPFLRHMPRDPFGLDEIRTNMEHFYSFYNSIYKEHIGTFDRNHLRDFMDYFFLRDKTQELHRNSVAVAIDVFAAGTETTSNTLLWLVIYLTRHTDVQDMFRKEIHAVIGDSRLPTLSDKENLPFVEATIYEVMRVSPVVPLGVPHAVKEDVMFKGFVIPGTATILTNIKSVLSDATVFQDPEQFRPERFLDASGYVRQPPEFMPFGIGPRTCLGESAARTEIFLIAVSIFQKFEFLPEGNFPPDRQGVLGVTYTPKPFKVRALRIH